MEPTRCPQNQFRIGAKSQGCYFRHDRKIGRRKLAPQAYQRPGVENGANKVKSPGFSEARIKTDAKSTSALPHCSPGFFRGRESSASLPRLFQRPGVIRIAPQAFSDAGSSHVIVPRINGQTTSTEPDQPSTVCSATTYTFRSIGSRG